jgi:hypothetical protein
MQVSRDLLSAQTQMILEGLAETTKATVLQIADQLKEEEALVLYRLAMVVTHMGEQEARDLADEAVKTHQTAGMKTSDGSRERTVGGVFLTLAGERLPPE